MSCFFSDEVVLVGGGGGGGDMVGGGGGYECSDRGSCGHHVEMPCSVFTFSECRDQSKPASVAASIVLFFYVL